MLIVLQRQARKLKVFQRTNQTKLYMINAFYSLKRTILSLQRNWLNLVRRIKRFELELLTYYTAFISLAHSETLLDLLRNQHLREFLKEIDSAPNAWKAMKVAMLEPLFIEFADECLKIVEDRES